MTAFDLEDFLTTAITDYAKEKVEAGTWDEEESLAKSQDSFNKLLYDGITTPNEYLYSIISGEKNRLYLVPCGRNPLRQTRFHL